MNTGLIAGDDDWGALALELVQQNYAFVASFSVVLWDCLITFHEEVKYIWHCPSILTKYLFFCSRYCALGYFIVCSIFGTQWTLQTPASRNDCRIRFLIHVASLSLLYTGSQIILIRKVFNLYGRSTLLAAGLFALHFVQIWGSYILSHHVSSRMNFNPICDGHDVPRHILVIMVSVICTQCLTWTLILRKAWKVRPGFFSSWRRYLPTSEAHAKLSWGLCLVPILYNSSLSFAHQRVAPVYIFTFPMVVISIGSCRYFLQGEKHRDTREKLVQTIDTAEGRVKQSVAERQLPSASGFDTPHTQNQHRPLYPPCPPAEVPWPPSDPEALSIGASEFQIGGYSLDTIVSNFPYLYGAQSYYRTNRNRRSTATTVSISTINTDHSLRASSDCANRRTVSVNVSHSRGLEICSVLHAGAADSAHGDNQNDETDETESACNIEIGSLHSSVSVTSEQLRRFYGDGLPIPVGP